MILMKYGSFAGEATVPGYEGWCILQSINWGCGQRHGVPAQGSRAKWAADLRPVTCTIGATSAAATLLRDALAGAPQTVEIHLTAWAGKESLEPVTTFKLERARVTSFTSASAGEEETHSFTLACATITLGFVTLIEIAGMRQRLRTGPDVYNVADIAR